MSEWIPTRIEMDEMSYESPITMYVEKVKQTLCEEQDDLVYREIVRQGVGVDKEELFRALQYDRDQYEKGYHDGVMASYRLFHRRRYRIRIRRANNGWQAKSVVIQR